MVKKIKNSTVAVLDIGSSKVVCFIAKIDPFGRIAVIGIGHNIAQGIKAGRITDIRAAEISVAQAVEAAEKMAGETIKSLYVGVSSNNLISQCVASELLVTGHEISDKDINRLVFQVLDKFNDQDLDVIHSFAYDYVLDGNRGIDNPLGMYGNSLAADFHILSSPTNYLLNINNCVARCQLEVDNFISSAYATGLSCLTQDEMDLGVTMIEFGGGCTSISVFNKGHILYSDALPIGGMHVTNDIARGFGTDFFNAERIKNLYGTVILTSADYDEGIEVPISSNKHDTEMNVVKRSELVEIIRARVEEILDISLKKLQASGMDKYGGNKLVITGGASQLSGLKEVAGHIFSKNVRIGYPLELTGLAESTSGIAFSSPIGMLLHIAKTNSRGNGVQSTTNDQGIISGVMQWFKENFG
ncbi:MAG: cell division protein FtsA [Candidatus Midichloriaceae bacterium]|jgi:cell division protein FtsA|nr:cell division protein FtsA [Candidatus Midichloriaceae bacterium]